MKKKNNVIILIPVITIVLVLAVVGTMYYKTTSGKDDKQESVNNHVESTQEVEETTVEEEEKASYLSETYYQGELSEYPELYEIPFQKSNMYISNKELYENSHDRFENIEYMATTFMEHMFNVNYRDLAGNPKAYVNTAMYYGDYRATHTIGYDTENERTESFEEYIEEICNYFIQNQVQMEAKFYTADSMVYSDFFMFVRGELVFTIYENKGDLPYKIGQEYAIPMEVCFTNFSESPTEYFVYSFGHPDDVTYFLNP